MYDAGAPLAGGAIPIAVLAVTGGLDVVFGTILGLVLAVGGLLILRANVVRRRAAE